jgi:hypothetical protein
MTKSGFIDIPFHCLDIGSCGQFLSSEIQTIPHSTFGFGRWTMEEKLDRNNPDIRAKKFFVGRPRHHKLLNSHRYILSSCQERRFPSPIEDKASNQ